MAKIYYRLIVAGSLTLEEVPELWRSDVEKLLKADTN